jgi:hypothetical protein
MGLFNFVNLKSRHTPFHEALAARNEDNDENWPIKLHPELS